MSKRYLVRLTVRPHSTGRGHGVDQIQAGSREQAFEIEARDIRDAMERAELIALGIGCNPIVWEAPIKDVRELGSDEDVPSRYDQHERDLHAAAKLRMPADPRVPVPVPARFGHEMVHGGFAPRPWAPVWTGAAVVDLRGLGVGGANV